MKTLTLPNKLSILRILLIPLLWYLALQEQRLAFAILLAITGITDFLDGFLARHLHQVSRFGSLLDSTADNLVSISALFWFWMLEPAFFGTYNLIILGAVALYIASLTYGFIKFKQLITYHLYTNKAGVLLFYTFFIHSILATPNLAFFFLTTTIIVLGLLEEIAITYTHDYPENDKLSIFNKKAL